MRFLYLALTLLLPASLSAYPTLSSGAYHSLVIDKDGTAFGWGDNSAGQLGTPAKDHTGLPMIVRKGIKAVAAGEAHTLLLDAQGNVFATGNNEDGRLGAGQIIDQVSTPRLVMSGVKAISAGVRHSIFLKTDGTAWTCGDDNFSQLGDGGPDDRQLTPVKVMSGVRAISAGSYHSMFLKTDGSVWAAGNNGSGQLGDGKRGQHEEVSQMRERSPIHIMDGVTAISAGAYHSLFLKKDGSVWTAGYNFDRQFEPALGELFNTPVKVMTGVTAIAAGSDNSFYLKSDGGLWSSGGNWYGELGDGSFASHYPASLVLKDVKEVAAGENHTIVRKKDGTIWMAGNNRQGQLGDGTFTDHSSFTEVPAFATPARPEIVILQPREWSLYDGFSRKNFGTVSIGGKGSTRTFFITNAGNKPLTGLSIKLKGADDKDFTSTQLAAATVKAGKTTSFEITFHPSKTGTRTARLQIKSNDKDESNFDIRLTGVGVK